MMVDGAGNVAVSFLLFLILLCLLVFVFQKKKKKLFGCVWKTKCVTFVRIFVIILFWLSNYAVLDLCLVTSLGVWV